MELWDGKSPIKWIEEFGGFKTVEEMRENHLYDSVFDGPTLLALNESGEAEYSIQLKPEYERYGIEITDDYEADYQRYLEAVERANQPAPDNWELSDAITDLAEMQTYSADELADAIAELAEIVAELGA